MDFVGRNDHAAGGDLVAHLGRGEVGLALGDDIDLAIADYADDDLWACLLYTSPSPRDKRQSRMPSSA